MDQDVWSLNCEIFAQLDSRWGQLSVDRFSASHYDAQLRRFNSDFCRRAVVQSIFCPRVGMVKTIGSVHQCLLLWMLLDTRVHAERSARSSFLNGRRLFSGRC